MSQPSQSSGLAAPFVLLVGILVGGGFLTMMLWESIPSRERKQRHTDTGPVIELTEKNWQAEVVESKIPVLVDVWAEWCGPCLKLSPIIDRLATRFEGKVKVGKVDLDTNKWLGEKYDIQSIPCVMLFNDGETPVRTLVGLQPEREYVKAIESVLKGS